MITHITKGTTMEYRGSQNDVKPLNVANGSVFIEIESGAKYLYDAENSLWIQWNESGISDEQIQDAVDNYLEEHPVVEKEWVLKGTITTAEKDTGVDVDLSGCTELVITGYTDSTSSMNLRGIADGKVYDLIGSVTVSGGRSLFVMYEDTGFGIFGNGKYATSTTATAYSGIITCYMVSGVSVADFTKIYYVVPVNITDCNLKIYAR